MPQLSLHSPVGDLTLSEEDGAIVALDWGWGRDQTPTDLLTRARAEIHAWFDGAPPAFTVPLAPAGTAYRQAVWRVLLGIPTGTTVSYAEIARRAGGAPRSVGQAVAANPIPLLIPCHRVIATSGLGGYSGGDGVATKRFLLALEARGHATGTTPRGPAAERPSEALSRERGGRAPEPARPPRRG